MSETERNAASLTRTIVVVVVSLCLAEESLSQQRPRQPQVSYGSQGSYVVAMSYEPFGPKEPFGPTEPPFGQPKQTAYGESQRLAPIRYEPFRPVPARQPSDYPRHPTEVRVLHLDEGDYCRRSHSYEPDYVCLNHIKCNAAIMNTITEGGSHLEICSFEGSQIIVCCPLPKRTAIVVPGSEGRPTEVTRPTTQGTTVAPNTWTPTKVTQPTTKWTTVPPYTTKVPVKTTQSKIKVTTNAPRTKPPPAKVTRPKATTTTVAPPTRKPISPPTTVPIPPSTTATVDNTVQNSNAVVEMCRRYNKLLPDAYYAYPKVLSGTESSPQEFPHMALLGYGMTTESRDDWKCGGSLINERWILTTANCQYRKRALARWVRLGEYNIESTDDLARPKDYQIVRHVLHPDYRQSERYNDIALFRLDSDVEFSAFVRPVCLNSDPSSEPPLQIATGWGSISTDGGNSDTLSKVALEIIPTNQCNATYFSNDNPKLKLGITPESMICAGAVVENEDACFGFSGGPLQVRNNDTNKLTYTQFGITSFGESFCGVKEYPGVYTRVSKYVPWIESVIGQNAEDENMTY